MRRFFRAALLLCDGLLLLLFLIGYLARYIHPRFAWWAELVATLLPYLTLLLFIATVLVVFSRQWKLLALHLLLVLLSVVRFVSWEDSVPADAEADLTLLTFNTSRGGGTRADVLGRAITKLIKTENPHLVGFQEAYVEYYPTGQRVRPEELLMTLVDSLGYETVGPAPAPGATYTSLPVLARIDLVDQSQFMLKPFGVQRERSFVLRTHFRWQDREAIHYNIHLRTFGYKKPWDDEEASPFSWQSWKTYLKQYRNAYLIRADEATQIRRLVDQDTLPVIISGDFNSTPHNWAFHHLAQGLTDAFQVAGEGWGATYHARLPLARIDHVLVSPAWQVSKAYIAQEAASDHLPVVVRLQWRP